MNWLKNLFNSVKIRKKDVQSLLVEYNSNSVRLVYRNDNQLLENLIQYISEKKPKFIIYKEDALQKEMESHEVCVTLLLDEIKGKKSKPWKKGFYYYARPLTHTPRPHDMYVCDTNNVTELLGTAIIQMLEERLVNLDYDDYSNIFQEEIIFLGGITNESSLEKVVETLQMHLMYINPEKSKLIVQLDWDTVEHSSAVCEECFSDMPSVLVGLHYAEKCNCVFMAGQSCKDSIPYNVQTLRRSLFP